MAEIGNDISTQSQNVSIPGLANARRAQEEDVRNQEVENQRAEETRQAEVRQEDTVSVNENGPGAIEQQEIRVEGETFNVPSQDIPENIGQRPADQTEFSQSVADLNETVPTAEDRASGDLDESGGGANQAANQPDNAAQTTGSGAQIEAAAEASAPVRAGAQGTLDVLEPVASEAIEVDSESAEGLTEADAGLAATSTGQANANNQILRQAVEEDADQRADQEDQANSQREPEQEQTDRGQNIDRLV